MGDCPFFAAPPLWFEIENVVFMKMYISKHGPIHIWQVSIQLTAEVKMSLLIQDIKRVF
jgi:hypothetical protein